MAIYHCRVKVVGRKGGRSIISASAYRNAAKMNDKETGLNYDYLRKRNVVHSEILYCENAPDEWKVVSDEAIEEFKKSAKYKKAADKEAVIEWFNVRYQKERLWNEVVKVENYADAQFAREFELAIPKECSWEESIQLVHNYVKNYLVNDGMCADIAIHQPDKETKNPHAHVLVTMRPIKVNGQWAPKETKEYALDENGNKIPVIDPATGLQKIGDRNRKVWQRVTVQKNYWNSEEKLMEWREGWAVECNKFLEPENYIDHRSYKDRGIDKTATLHEGYAARKIEEQGQTSWVCELNREIKHANNETKLLELRTGWAIEDFNKIEDELEEDKNVALRRETGRIDAQAGRKSADKTIIESSVGAEEGYSGTDERVTRRDKLIQLEREVEQREREITGATQAAASERPDRRYDEVETAGAGTGQRKRRTRTRKRGYVDTAAGTRSCIAKSAEGLPDAARSFTARTRGIFGARIAEYTKELRKYIDEVIRRIRNQLEQRRINKRKDR